MIETGVEIKTRSGRRTRKAKGKELNKEGKNKMGADDADRARGTYIKSTL